MHNGFKLSLGLLINEEKGGPERSHENPKDGQLNNEVGVVKNENVNTRSSAIDSNDPIQADLSSCILKCKSVFKCRLCPRIVCLNEETVKQHLKSKVKHHRALYYQEPTIAQRELFSLFLLKNCQMRCKT